MNETTEGNVMSIWKLPSPVFVFVLGTSMMWGDLPSLHAQDTAGRTMLLKTFVDELVPIQPGEAKFPRTFEMGLGSDDEPRRTVTMSTPFRMARYEVPQNLYTAVMGKNPSRWTGPRNSVEMMDYHEAVRFCEQLTEMLRAEKLIADDERVRLPTETEWEYCCRAGTATAYSFGDAARKAGEAGAKASILDAFAWHIGNAAGNDPPVGALKPNPWGLYDVHGYLWEMTSTPWKESDADTPADAIVIKGGSWRDSAEDLRSGVRKAFRKDARGDAVGIRCVVSRVTPDAP